ncbi:hypothetical protein GGX14DRAFT_454608 [Mycena pura]|uniref:Uncharacterized protein n=1 Tax=Mycena pura TaxID=153505 RepID=A0AAD6YDT8_9AGAR|nr:hypothetical protein GGX14DRAFT_454608 [Mycena pura]
MAPDAREIEGRYWLSRRCMFCSLVYPHADTHELCRLLRRNRRNLRRCPTPAETLPEETLHGYKKRKYDASLRPSTADYSQHSQNKAKLFVSILSHEYFEFAVIDDCFGSNITTVSALLHLFRIVSFARQSFSRATLSKSLRTVYVVKMGYIADHRLWREKIIVDPLHPCGARARVRPKDDRGVCCLWFTSDQDPEILRNTWKRSASTLPAMVRRHLGIMAFESPPDARALKYIPSAAGLLTAAKDLFLAILDAFRRRALHRDISVNNVLVANNQLLMVDWEIGRLFQEP